VDEIWLTFSDPQPKKPNKRLSSAVFIERYKKLLRKGGKIHLKTDSDLLYAFTMEEIETQGYQLLYSSPDIYAESPSKINEELRDILPIKTHYEKLFTAKGAVIKYCCFTVN
jgi:tRNA (guanine-N7-)-methyltransferase